MPRTLRRFAANAPELSMSATAPSISVPGKRSSAARAVVTGPTRRSGSAQ
jgi:hypothetical protein